MGAEVITLPPGAVLVEDGREAQFDCWECGRRRAYVNTSTGLGICFRCGKTYKASDFEGPERPEAPKLFTSALPTSGLGLPAYKSFRANRYLQGRGVDPHEFPSIYCNQDGLLFPVRHTLKPTQGWMQRTWEGKWLARDMPDKSAFIYAVSYDPAFFEGEQLVLVEGIFDVLTPRLRWGVALLGTRLSPPQERFLQLCLPRAVLVWLDPDGAGQAASQRILARLRSLGLEANSTRGPHVDGREPGDCKPEDLPEAWRF